MTATVQVAHWRVQLRGDSADVLTALHRRYDRFCGLDEHPPDIACDVTVVGAQTDGRVWRTEADAGATLLEAPGLSATWDRASGRVAVRVAASCAEGGVELALRTLCAYLAFDAGGLLVHGAGIIVGSHAYVFVGPSGAGKTTLSRLSAANHVLNDDLVVLSPGEGGWRVFSTPFWNPTQVPPQAGHARLAGIFRLRHAATPEVRPVRPGAALATLVRAVPVLTGDPIRLREVFGRCRRLLMSTRLAELAFAPEPSFWQVIRQSEHNENPFVDRDNSGCHNIAAQIR